MQRRIRLEALEDRQLLATFAVNNVNDSGVGSLRQAILGVNGDPSPGQDTITFAIAGSNAHKILLNSPLPALTHAVLIDGYSEPLSTKNTQATGDNANPLIVLDGTNAGTNANGLVLNAGNSVVQGLVIDNFGLSPGLGAGIVVNVGGDVIQGNFLGVDSTGSAAAGNGEGISVQNASDVTIGGPLLAARNVIAGNTFSNVNIVSTGSGRADRTVVQGNLIGTNAAGGGVPTGATNNITDVILQGATATTIGGTTPGARNVVSGAGNGGNGIEIFPAGSNPGGGNLIQGNLIGTDAAAAVALPDGVGIAVFSGGNTIGGAAPGAGNVISGNGNAGITLVGTTGQASNNVVQGNFIGTDRLGTANLPNAGGGVYVATSNNLIGGTAPGAGNLIYNNVGAGVRVDKGASGVGILGDGFLFNTGLGIDITSTSPNPINNNNQPAPSLNSVVASGSRTNVAGTLNAAPNTTYLLNFFGNSTPIPMGQTVQGQTYLGSATVTTDAAGFVSFTGFPSKTVAVGDAVTATATDPLNNTSPLSGAKQATAPVGPAADLSVEISAPAVASAGKPLTYTILVANIGLGDATDVLLTDTLPAALTSGSFLAVVGPASFGGTVDTASGSLVVNLGTVPAHTQATVTLTVTPAIPAPPAVTQLANSVTVSADQADPTLANDSASDQVTVLPPANLSALIQGPGQAIIVNTQFTYTLTLGNNGPGNATGATLTDTLPAGLTYVSAATTAGVFTRTGNVLTFSVGNLAAGATATATVLVKPTAVGPVTDSVTASGDQLDQVPGNDSSSATTTIIPAPAVLSVALAAAPSPVTVGQGLTYTLTVTNTGGSDATNVSLADTLPAGATYVSSTSSAPGTPTVAAGVLSAALGTLAPNAQATVTILVTPTAAGTLTDSVVLNSDQTGASPPSAVSTSVDPAPPSLAISLSSPTATPTAGSPLTYVLTVTNTGLGSATNATVTDALPAGAAYQSATTTAGTTAIANGIVTANLGTLAPNTSATITIVVNPTAAGSLTDSAAVTSDQTAPVTAAPLTRTIAPEPADLTVTITPSAHPALNQPLTYLVTVSNAGPAVASHVVLTDTLPAGVAYTSASSNQGGAPSQANGVVRVDFGSLAVGSSATLTIVGLPGVAASGRAIVDTATVTAPEPDETPSNRQQSNTISISPPADLVLTLAPQPASPLVNQPVTYTLTVTNAGPSDATGVVVTDTLPVNATFNSATPSGVRANGKITLNLGSIPAGGHATATIVVTPAAIGSLTDSATVQGDQFDGTLANNSATSAISVSQASVLQVATPVVGTLSNAGTALVTVARGGGANGIVTVQYTTQDGSGRAGTDYTATTGTLTFNPGQTSQTFGVPILDPHQVQGLRTFTVVLSNPGGGASLGGATTAQVTITNTDAPGKVQFVAATSRVSQSAGTASITVTRTDGSDVPFSVAYSTTDGTAHAGTDYTSTAGTLAFAVGQTAATITIPVANRGLAGQAPRTFALTLSNPTANVAIGTQATTAVTVFGPAVLGDYSGAGRANPAVFDENTSTFIILPAAGGTPIIQQFGYLGHGNVPLGGDYDADGKADLGIFDPTSSTFAIIPSGGGVALVQQFGYVGHGNVPVVGDFYGNQKTDIGIFDPTSSTFAILPSGAGLPIILPLGNPAHHDVPIVGDYFGDGRDALGVYDPVTSTFLIRETGGTRQINLQFGNAANHLVPLVGDYTGDGKADIGFYDPTSSFFVVIPSEGGRVTFTQFGDPSHHLVPLAGSYDGTGRVDVGYFDPTTATLAFLPTGTTLAVVQPLGTAAHSEIPLPAVGANSGLRAAIRPAAARPVVNDRVLTTALDAVRTKK